MGFSKREIILNSWQVLKAHLGLWILIMLFISFLNIIISIIQEKQLENITTQTILFTVSAYLFQAGLNLGMLKIALNIHGQKEAGLNQVFGSFHMLLVYILATLVYLTLIFVAASPGIVLLIFSISADINSIVDLQGLGEASFMAPLLLSIVPAVYASIRLQFYDYFLIDNEGGAIESIIKSISMTKGHAGELFVLGAALSVIILISMIPLMIGLLISIPLTIMVNTSVYLKLNRSY
jgi:uncharacterized membrane protein